MKKRILSVVLCVAMLLSVVPFTLVTSAAAADNNTLDVFTVPENGEIKDSGDNPGLIQYGSFPTQSSVTVNGENFFSSEITAASKYVSYLPGSYMADGSATNVTMQELYPGVDLSEYNYLAVRFKISGGDATKTARLWANCGPTNATSVMMNHSNNKFVNYNETAPIVADKNVFLPSNFDGWIIFAEEKFESGATIENLYRVSFAYFEGASSISENTWIGRTVYVGDMKLVKDVEAFSKACICSVKGHVEGTAATCKDKAVCSVCGQSYGEVDATKHGTNTELKGVVEAECGKPGYTGDTWCKDCNTEIAKGTATDALTHKGGEATCSAKAVCDLCEQEYGEVKADNHKNTELKGVVEAECGKPGYSGDTWCKDCNTEIAKGTATDALTHKGGEATCSAKAVCDLCEQAYGEVKADNHKNTELKNKKDATCEAEGYSGDTWCKDCDKEVKKGEVVKKLDHVPATELANKKDATTTEKGYTGDKVCKECGAVMEAGKEIPVIVEDNKDDTTTGGNTTDDENAGGNTEGEGTTAPETGDNASILLAVLMTLMAGAVVVLAKKRAQSK